MQILRVMSFNLWIGGDAGGQPLARTLAVIDAARADVVGLQETRGSGDSSGARPDRAAEIARRLGWSCLDQGDGVAVISRFPIVDSTPTWLGARIALPSGDEFYLFNVHLMYTPYQPYQLLNIPYNNAPFLRTADDAILAARATRGAQVERLLAEIASAELDERVAAFVTGDFNEPSHLDWTDAARDAGLCPIAVEWPSTQALADAGFVDAYRRIHPDPLGRPGLTWTPTTRPDDPADRHDRIDFVFARGANLSVTAAQIVGESSRNAEIAVDPYPSDHRAVVAEFALAGS